MKKKLPNLPKGQFSFEKIRENKSVYVDIVFQIIKLASIT
ncbi:hypothetical protein MTBBW1_1770021 [Desulfamplus magnetovallimortis]|uniref:Uncharacterized protein n=1 Tax=Desulfamplus magnetovallimortis TaxID=1246637 RepID=A0A1W1HA95_9BACT|nr:hypothetical protein MTBBW1_1770021 [Desulfamplus magnetovallimortis]